MNSTLAIKGFFYFGTGAGLPSLVRNVSAMAVDFESEWFLFDCGEGTQQRIMKSPLKMTRLTHIFISHFHGDHLYGLPGLLATMQLQGITSPLTIVGPKGIKNYVEFIYDISGSRKKRVLNFIEIDEANTPKEIYEHQAFTVIAAKMKHKITCFGFRLNMKNLPGRFDNKKADELGVPNNALRKDLVQGKEITLENGEIIKPEMLISEERKNQDFTYITDTSVCENISLLAKNSDFLHHECTFMDDETELAKKSGHCTFDQVVEIADKIGIKQLQLAHFSPRYDSFSLANDLQKKPYKILLTRDNKYYKVK
jgi:ribonuclease Z